MQTSNQPVPADDRYSVVPRPITTRWNDELMGNQLSILLSVVALVVSVSVAFYTQWAMNRREVDKSRREMLTRSVASLIEKSTSRNESIRDWALVGDYDDMSNAQSNILLKLEREMVFDLVQIRIAGSRETCDAASKLQNLHSISQEMITRFEQADVPTLRPHVDQKELENHTNNLIRLVRIETGLK